MNPRILTVLVVVAVIGVVVYAVALAFRLRTGPGPLGLREGRFHKCDRPHSCVSSDSPNSTSFVAPFRIEGSPGQTWDALRKAIESTARTRIVEDSDDYIHAEFTMPIIPFVDDLELNRRPEDSTIAVRSASRIGHRDLGVNRRRVERLRRRIGQ